MYSSYAPACPLLSGLNGERRERIGMKKRIVNKDETKQITDRLMTLTSHGYHPKQEFGDRQLDSVLLQRACPTSYMFPDTRER